MGFQAGQPSDDGSGSDAELSAADYEALSRRLAQARAAHQGTPIPLDPIRAALGLRDLTQIYYNLSVPELIEHGLMQGEGGLSAQGAFCVKTVPHTERSPQDFFVVTPSSTQSASPTTQILSEQTFEHLFQEVQTYVQGQGLYFTDGYAGGSVRIPVRMVTELASHSLLARHLLEPDERANAIPTELAIASPEGFVPQITLIVLPGFKGEPSLNPELRSEVFVALHPQRNLALIGGSRHGGEIVEALLRLLGHCLAHQRMLLLPSTLAFVHGSSHPPIAPPPPRPVLFLGDEPQRDLLADALGYPTSGASGHSWSPLGLMPALSGSYRAIAPLAPAPPSSPLASLVPPWTTAIRFGALLENVVLDPRSGLPHYGDRRWAKLPRAAYGLSPSGIDHPRASCTIPQVILLLVQDVLGVLPPIARLTPEQLLFYFLCGYGCGERRQSASSIRHPLRFVPCFDPSLSVEDAIVRTAILGDRLRRYNPGPDCWLVNTSKLQLHSHSISASGEPQSRQQEGLQELQALLAGAGGGETLHPVFQFLVPTPLTPLLAASEVQAPGAALGAMQLARQFRAFFERFEGRVCKAVSRAGPQL